LKLILNPEGKYYDAINIVPLETYLVGVIGAEMPNYWEPEALNAQAIAARTYCFYIKKRFGVNRGWDVSKTQSNQVYLGISAESDEIWDAVNKTQGRIIAKTIASFFPRIVASLRTSVNSYSPLARITACKTGTTKKGYAC